MKILYLITEVLLAITFIFGGINGLLLPLGYQPFIPANPASEFATILAKTDYIFILQKVVELLCGILLLIRKFRFVSLIALAPIVISIFVYHIFDDKANLHIGITVFVLFIIALLGHKKNIENLLKSN